jgi:hypothetical protein
MMSEVLRAKLLDGKPARFLRDYGEYKFVVEVDGQELAILRAVWHSLPFDGNVITPPAPADDADST